MNEKQKKSDSHESLFFFALQSLLTFQLFYLLTFNLYLKIRSLFKAR